MESKQKFYEDKTLMLLCMVVSMGAIAVPGLGPALPNIKEALALTNSQASWILAIFALPSALFTPFAGVLADRIGRKGLMIPSLFAFGIIGAVSAFSPDYTTLIILRFLQGVVGAPLIFISVTVAGDIYKGERRTWAMGYITAALSLAVAVFAFLGGMLSDLYWRLPFLLALLAIPIALACKKSLNFDDQKQDTPLKEYFKGVKPVFSDTRTLVLLSMTFLSFMVIYGPFVTYLPQVLRDNFGASGALTGLLQLAIPVVFTLVSSRLSVLTQLFGRNRLFFTSYTLYTLAWIICPVAGNLWTMLGVVVLFGLAQGLNLPALPDQLVQESDPQYRGLVMSANGFVTNLAQSLAPLFSVLLYSFLGFYGVYWVGGIGLVLGMAYLRYSKLQELKKDEAEATDNAN